MPPDPQSRSWYKSQVAGLEKLLKAQENFVEGELREYLLHDYQCFRC